MFKSWRLGKLFGFPIEINLSFLLLLGLVLVAFGGLMGVLVVCLAFASVVLHELGHAIVARKLGVHVAGIELGFLGGAAKMVNLPRTWTHELMIAAAGPAVSLILGGIGIGIGVVVGSPFIAMIGWINLVIAAFNLIPALPMDGGRILRALLVPKFGFVRATDIAVAVARVAAVGFVVFGITAQMYQLLILAPFIWLMGTREKLLARMVPEQYPSSYARDERGHDEAATRGSRRYNDVELLGRDASGDRRERRGWGSPFDPRSGGGGIRRYTIVQRNGRMYVESID